MIDAKKRILARRAKFVAAAIAASGVACAKVDDEPPQTTDAAADTRTDVSPEVCLSPQYDTGGEPCLGAPYEDTGAPEPCLSAPLDSGPEPCLDFDPDSGEG